MKWQTQRRSDNVEDRRRIGRPTAFAGGGMVIIGVIVMLILGKDPTTVLQVLQNGNPSSAEVVNTTPHEDSLAEMSSVILASTEDVWQQLFQKKGKTYMPPKLVLFSGSVESACGFAQSAMGPFYCSGDNKLYLDLSFFDELGNRLSATGDFAQAYVIAHEVGHHIQNLLGILEKIHTKQSGVDEKTSNQLSVRLELQADFYAGIWAYYADKTMQMLEKGDLEEALNAASQIGDDRLQKQSQGYIVPDSFTHGTSAQRLKWFLKGYQSGDPDEASLLFELKNL